MHSSYNSNQGRRDSYLERSWKATWKFFSFENIFWDSFENNWRRGKVSPLVQIPFAFIWSKSARPSKALRNRPTTGASLYIPWSGKGLVSQNNYQPQQSLTANVTGPQMILLWPLNPTVPKSNQNFRYCYCAYQSSIFLDLIMLLPTSDSIHVP